MTYDSNGNILSDGFHNYTWDADGKLATLDGDGLTYDALGRRVEQASGSGYTQIVYGPAGNKLALMNRQTVGKVFAPLPGGATAGYTTTGLSYFRHPDWLGSSRPASTPLPLACGGRRFCAVLMLFSLASCTDPTVWSAVCRSPDQLWTARAHTVEHGGFGSAGVETVVELKRANNSCSSEQVLAFADDGRAMKLRMHWDSPTHFEVVYDADPEVLYYQVVKMCGVNISVQDLRRPRSEQKSEEAPNELRVKPNGHAGSL